MIEHVMPLCLTISWVYTVAMLVQSVVYEKEQRLKEVTHTLTSLSLTSLHGVCGLLTQKYDMFETKLLQLSYGKYYVRKYACVCTAVFTA